MSDRVHRAAASLFLLCTAVVLASGCGAQAAPSFTTLLHTCSADEGPADAYCGGYQVFENRALGSGRIIRLNIVVLPALGADAHPDPLVFLAGGPGQGAAQMATLVQAAFRSVQRHRDIVLVDQRGTGRSNPLNCPPPDDSLAALTEPEDQALESLRRCLAMLPGDPRLYLTTIAMDDLDEVRSFLGYDKVNLYGGSYGTRAALVYLRQHPDRVRTMVLDGVAPTDMRLPLFAARDAQRALDKLAADCANDAACRAAYPNLGDRVRALLARLDATRPTVRLVHPRTGLPETVALRAPIVASIIVGALYSPLTSSILPALLERAEHDDFQGLLALAYMRETDTMSVGMQLSILCSEDAPRYTVDDIARESAGTAFGAGLTIGQARACEFWPKGEVDPSYYEPVRSSTPTLILSGDLDPVTPPAWGQAVARTLTNVRHYTLPGTGHGVMGTACGNTLIAEFVARASVERLPDRCVGQAQRPGFFLSPAGPEPAPTSGAAP